ncbi:MAG: FlgD immunoglobulin-like domain containing protein [candidate division KSB1 bacterium]|nr:FlgD immunoglobulin-like domain containing protein [candidate division KSB1 bacterium]
MIIQSPVITTVYPINPLNIDRFSKEMASRCSILLQMQEMNPAFVSFFSSNLDTLRVPVDNDSLSLTVDLSDLASGNHSVYCMVGDSARNTQLDSFSIDIDLIAPGIEISQWDTLTQAGEDYSVSARITDDVFVEQALLYYKKGGWQNFNQIEMNATGDVYSAVIPGDSVGMRGIEFKIQASDALYSPFFPLDSSVLCPNVQWGGDRTAAFTLIGGSEADAYRMVSIPFEPANNHAEAVLVDNFGPFEDETWRFLYWQPLNNQYVEYPDIQSLEPAQAYWSITLSDSVNFSVTGGKSISTKEAYDIKLYQGWNDIALPFTFNITWDDIVTASTLDTSLLWGPFTFDKRWIYPFEIKTLEPWQGYSLYCESEQMTLKIPPIEAGSSLNKPYGSVLNWGLQLIAVCGASADSMNIIGTAENANDAFDRYDYVEAPVIGDYITLFFPHPDWKPVLERFGVDIRAPKHKNTWVLHVENSKPECSVELFFHTLTPLPDDLHLVLKDQQANIEIDLTQESSYQFLSNRDMSPRTLEIIGSSSDHLAEESEDTAEPRKILQNHPNPFNSTTVISFHLESASDVKLVVYNLLAQRVRGLKSGFLEKGFHQISWDGLDDFGNPVGTGIYILRLETKEYSQTRKMIYTR